MVSCRGTNKPWPSHIRRIDALFVWTCLAYKTYFFSQRTVFFSHTKSVNSTFSHNLSAKQAQTNRARTRSLSFPARNADSRWHRHGTWERVYDCKQKAHVQNTMIHSHVTRCLVVCRPVMHRHATPCCRPERARRARNWHRRFVDAKLHPKRGQLSWQQCVKAWSVIQNWWCNLYQQNQTEWCCCETAINSKISGQLGTCQCNLFGHHHQSGFSKLQQSKRFLKPKGMRTSLAPFDQLPTLRLG